MATSVTSAGPLNPPAGPVAPTGRTLTEIEPRIPITEATTPSSANSVFTITQPGSYYLTGNLLGVAGKHGIRVAASNVTIDLNGFEVLGSAGGINSTLDGITTAANAYANIRIVNGAIRAWGNQGIDMADGAFAITVENVRVSSCAINFRLGPDSRVRGCLSLGSLSIGVIVGASSVVSDTVATGSDGNGFNAGDHCVFEQCTARANVGSGFSVSSSCVVRGCTASENGVWGINAGFGSLIESCTAASNTQAGIRVSSSTRVVGNVCTGNGPIVNTGAGVLATDSGNVIEDNLCRGNDLGIQVTGAGNVIRRNASGGNTTNWSIAANNIYGPIVDRTAPGSAPVTTNSAVSTLGTTDPSANFTH